MECYRRAEPHWERRHEVRARSTDTVKRGVGMASQIWYGGGGPPSYAWTRVGSDGRVTVITAMQDIGTGTRTAMAQIAAEELGIPLEHVTVTLGDSDRGPYAAISAGSSTVPSMGPAVRAAAADAKRQIIEIAAQRYHLEERTLDIKDGVVSSADGNLSAPLEEVVGLLEDAQILGKGARGPNPTGMQVLTFGVQVAEVAVDVADRRGLGRPDRSRPRRRPRDQPARSVEPGRGRDHPGHRPHALRGAAARSTHRADPHDRARRVQAADDRGRARRSSASWSTSPTST